MAWRIVQEIILSEAIYLDQTSHRACSGQKQIGHSEGVAD
ncbi:hypothetical protein PhaeoP71_02107 [Phaeobacter piscinae]|nr:hypothetical protein PhaeoP71_02107 [Phaeobacter piscinae]